MREYDQKYVVIKINSRAMSLLKYFKHKDGVHQLSKDHENASILEIFLSTCPAIIPDLFTANAYPYYSFVSFLPYTSVSRKAASHT